TPRYLRPSRDLYHRPYGAEAGTALAIRVSGSDVAREEVERARIERDLLGPILTRAHAELTARHAVTRDGLRLREERRPEGGALVVTLAVLVGVLRPEVEGLARRDIDEQLAKLRVRRDLGDDRGGRQGCGDSPNVGDEMATLSAIGIVTKDMKESVRFYRLLGVDVPDPSGDHLDATLPSGVALMWDTLELIKQLDPDWTEPAGHR